MKATSSTDGRKLTLKKCVKKEQLIASLILFLTDKYNVCVLMQKFEIPLG
jgi:hypothetical protein